MRHDRASLSISVLTCPLNSLHGRPFQRSRLCSALAALHGGAELQSCSVLSRGCGWQAGCRWLCLPRCCCCRAVTSASVMRSPIGTPPRHTEHPGRQTVNCTPPRTPKPTPGHSRSASRRLTDYSQVDKRGQRYKCSGTHFPALPHSATRERPRSSSSVLLLSLELSDTTIYEP